MSDYIPFEIQSDIINRLPVKSLLQFRSVSKQWKSFIDNPEFIKNYHINNPKHHLLVRYHINHPNPKHHLLVQYELDKVPTYTSIMDDITFPQQKFPLTAPKLLNLLRCTTILGSVDGLLAFYGFYVELKNDMIVKQVVIWNPSVRKFVGIVIPYPMDFQLAYTRMGFGVCPLTNDPKLVKINVIETPSICWEVQVFTLSSRVWRTVYTGAPFKLCDLFSDHVFIDGVIYWLSSGSFLISFDLKSDKFGEVYSIPERFVGTCICLAKVNESLGLLEYYIEGGMSLCGVWISKDGVNKPFTKMYTIKVEGNSVFNRVLGFRNNGEVVLQLDDDDDFKKSQLEVYEPSSRRINSVGISGERFTFKVWSYIETLLLLDQSDAIIH